MGHVPGVLSCELGRWPTLPQWSEAEGTPHLPLHAVQHLQDPVSPVTPLPEVGTASAPPPAPSWRNPEPVHPPNPPLRVLRSPADGALRAAGPLRPAGAPMASGPQQARQEGAV